MVTTGEIISAGTQTIYDGGIANSAIIESSGNQYISSGGDANSTTVFSGGQQIVLSGGTTTKTEVKTGGYLTIYSAGNALNTIINREGSIRIYDGGSAVSSIINYGSMYVGSESLASYTTVNFGGWCFIGFGGTANNTTLNVSGNQLVSSGATASKTTIHSGAWQYVSGTAHSTTIESNGNMSVLSGTAYSTLINSNGSQYVHYGTVYDTNIIGYQSLNDDAVAIDTIVNGGMQYIYSGVAINTTLNGGVRYSEYIGVSWGTQVVYENAVVSNTTINSNGILYLHAGASASTVIQNSGGMLDVNTSATITNGSNTRTDGGDSFSIINGVASNLFIESQGSLEVLNGHSAVNTIAENGSIYIHSGGSAYVTNMGSYTYMEVFSGGAANNTTIGYNAQMVISSGGTASLINQLSGGKLLTGTDAEITSGTNTRSDGYNSFSITNGVANNFFIESGSNLDVFSGHSAINTIIDSWGCLNIYDGGSASIINQLNRGKIKCSTEATITSGINTRNDGHSSFSLINGKANNFLIESGGSLFVNAGHSATNTVIESGGFMYVSSGGSASNIIQQTRAGVGGDTGATIIGGSNNRWQDGYTSFSIINGVASNFYLESGGRLTVLSGHSAVNTLLTSGSIYISSGGTATIINQSSGGTVSGDTGATITSGTNTRSDGHSSFSIISGIASNLLIDHGKLTVLSGHSAIDTIVNTGGELVIHSGGIASETTANFYGQIHLSGGTAENTDINHGFFFIYSGGTSIKTLLSYGTQYVNFGGTASNTTINSMGITRIESGGTTINTAIGSNGSMQVQQEATASNTTILSGGSMLVNSFGQAHDISVFSGGYLSILSRGGVSGELMVHGGIIETEEQFKVNMTQTEDEVNLTGDADLSLAFFSLTGGGSLNISGINNYASNFIISGGGALNFDVTGFITPNDELMLADIYGIDTDKVTLTVASSQAKGHYLLAGNAMGFDQVITICNDDHIGYVDLDNDLFMSGALYSLDIIGGILELTVSSGDITPPSVPQNTESTVNGYRAILDWSDSIDDFSSIKEYILEYADNALYTNSLIVAVSSSDYETEILSNSTYYWRVKAVDNSENESSWSPTSTFTILPDHVAPTTPGGLNYNVNDYAVTLSWNASTDSNSGLKQYIVEFAESITFNDATVQATSTSEISIDNCTAGIYYWRVKAIDNAENSSAWSSVSSFTVTSDTVPPNIPDGLEEDIHENNVILAWDNATDNFSGTIEYVVEYADNLSFNYASARTTTTNQRSIGGIKNGNYYWRVKAVDPSGNASAWSQTKTLSIAGAENYIKILASDGDQYDLFGESVSISGNDILIGSSGDDSSVDGIGSCYLYKWNGLGYDEYKITASDRDEKDYLGNAVSISNNIIAVGAYGDKDHGQWTGSAYVYHWSNDEYTEYKLTASDGRERMQFGHSISVSNNNVAIGTYDETGGAYVYRWNGFEYIEFSLTSSDKMPTDYFGNSVYISGDTVVVGAESYGDGYLAQYATGQAYVFKWNGVEYEEIYILQASDGEPVTKFGHSVCISNNNIVVGSNWRDDFGHQSGAAYVYRWNGNTYDEYKLTAYDAVEYDYFGETVAISGNFVAVGSIGSSNDKGNQAGSVYVYRWNGETYDEVVKLAATDVQEYAHFGSSIAIDGDTLVVGAYRDQSNGIFSGSTYVYSLSDLFDFVDNIAPSIPSTYSATIENRNVFLDWNDSIDDESGIQGYIVEYSQSAEFTNAITENVTTSALYVYGLDETTWYWRVKAVDLSGNESDWSSVNSFVIDIADTTPPSVPLSLTYNVDGANAQLDWNDSTDNQSGVKEYIVQYSVNSNFSDVDTLTVTQSQIDLESLSDGTWYWRVKAVDNDGNTSIWSTTETFVINTLDLTPPDVPDNLNYDIVSTGIKLEWDESEDDLSGIKEYHIQYSGNLSFNNAETYTSTENEFNVSDLSYGFYFWRVKAVDNAGHESDWSDIESFNTGDTAGNYFSKAREIEFDDQFSYNEYVGARDGFDYYTFDISRAGEFDFELKNLYSKASLCIYRLDNSKGQQRAQKIKNTSGDSNVAIDDVLLSQGTYFIEVASGDKGSGKYNTGYTLEIESDYLPEHSNDEFDFKTGAGTPVDLDIETGASDWVGFGDPQDVYKFDVTSAGEFDFALTGLESKTSLALYGFQKGKFKRIKNASAKTDKITGETIASFDNVLLDSGTYYLEVMSGDKGKGKCNTAYDLEVSAVTFPEATENNSWQQATEIVPDVQLSGFIGFGDACDCFKFEVNDLTAFDFDLAGEDKNARLTVYLWDNNKNKLKKVAKTGLKYGEAHIDNLYLDAGLYYVEVLSADKGKGKMNTEYELDITATG